MDLSNSTFSNFCEMIKKIHQYYPNINIKEDEYKYLAFLIDWKNTLEE